MWQGVLENITGFARSLPGNARNSPSEPGEPAAGEGACANYLAAHYGLPQTYREGFLRRVAIPVLAMIAMLTLIALLTAMLLGSSRQGSALDWSIFPVAGLMLLAVCYVASNMRRGMTIRANSIEIAQAFSTRVIRAGNVLGYATDYVRVNHPVSPADRCANPA